MSSDPPSVDCEVKEGLVVGVVWSDIIVIVVEKSYRCNA